jgi:DNA-directed RNA polymerase subunit F
VEWVHFRDVGRLDAAFCNRKLRRLFLGFVRHGSIVFRGTVSGVWYYMNAKHVLEWVITRKVHLDGIVIDDQLQQNHGLLRTFLRTSSSTIRRVRTDCHRPDRANQSALLEIAKWCPNVEQLDVRAVCTDDSAMLWDERVIAVTKACHKLIDLSLFNAQFSEQGLAAALTYCTGLQSLSVDTPSQVIPLEIAIPTLKSLRCGSGCMTDEVLIAIGQRCSKLEALTMFADNNQLTDVGVQAVLQGCPHLCKTDVECGRGISTELRVELVRRRNATTLDTSNWRKMNDELAQSILEVSPSLTKLSCAGSWLTDATLAVCAQHCPSLQVLVQSNCKRITDDGLRVLVSSILRVVELRECTQLSDKILLAIAELCPLLEKVACTADVADAVVVKLAEGCPELNYVHLYKSQLDGTGVTALVTHCPNLATLLLYSCPNITVKDARNIITGCPHLSTLGLPYRLRNKQLLQFVHPLRTISVAFVAPEG